MTIGTVCPGCHQTVPVQDRCPLCGYPLRFSDIDDGPLDLGVARRVHFRDLNARNDLHFFHENFEGVIGLDTQQWGDDAPEEMIYMGHRDLWSRLLHLRYAAEDVAVMLAYIGGLGIVAALNVLVWRWAL